MCTCFPCIKLAPRNIRNRRFHTRFQFTSYKYNKKKKHYCQVYNIVSTDTQLQIRLIFLECLCRNRVKRPPHAVPVLSTDRNYANRHEFYFSLFPPDLFRRISEFLSIIYGNYYLRNKILYYYTFWHGARPDLLLRHAIPTKTFASLHNS